MAAVHYIMIGNISVYREAACNNTITPIKTSCSSLPWLPQLEKHKRWNIRAFVKGKWERQHTVETSGCYRVANCLPERGPAVWQVSRCLPANRSCSTIRWRCAQSKLDLISDKIRQDFINPRKGNARATGRAYRPKHTAVTRHENKGLELSPSKKTQGKPMEDEATLNLCLWHKRKVQIRQEYLRIQISR